MFSYQDNDINLVNNILNLHEIILKTARGCAQGFSHIYITGCRLYQNETEMYHISYKNV